MRDILTSIVLAVSVSATGVAQSSDARAASARGFVFHDRDGRNSLLETLRVLATARGKGGA